MIMEIQKTKKCSMCKQELPLSMYHANNSRKDGLQTYCKECGKKYYENKRNKQSGGGVLIALLLMWWMVVNLSKYILIPTSHIFNHVS